GAFQWHGTSGGGMAARQLLEACALEEGPRYLIRDRDQVYGERFSRQAKRLGIREIVIAPRSPWQNAYAERVIGSIRRECLDHVVVIGTASLRGLNPWSQQQACIGDYIAGGWIRSGQD